MDKQEMKKAKLQRRISTIVVIALLIVLCAIGLICAKNLVLNADDQYLVSGENKKYLFLRNFYGVLYIIYTVLIFIFGYVLLRNRERVYDKCIAPLMRWFRTRKKRTK